MLTLGWRERVGLPELGIQGIKAKVDTGARTSALHAFRIEEFQKNDAPWIAFWVHPKQRDHGLEIRCEARVVDRRVVSDSGGHKEMRFVIETQLEIGSERWPIEITLTGRDDMRFRMLLGRTAIRGRALVDPDRSYLVSRRRKPSQPPERR